MVLLALMVAVVGYILLRKQGKHFSAWMLAAMLGIAGGSVHMEQAAAVGATYTVVLAPGSNIGTVTIPGSPGLTPVSVQNTLTVPVTVTSISVRSGLTLDAATTLMINQVVPGSSTVVNGVWVKCDPLNPNCTPA
ncbi:MAG: hypothetical protein IPN53_23645 [Comamonadaceae bacterium]|nr:hypothetical protein [Comamonadaceae bacterium]